MFFIQLNTHSVLKDVNAYISICTFTEEPDGVIIRSSHDEVPF